MCDRDEKSTTGDDIDAKVAEAVAIVKASREGIGYEDLYMAIGFPSYSDTRARISDRLARLGWPENGRVLTCESSWYRWDTLAEAEHAVTLAGEALYRSPPADKPARARDLMIATMAVTRVARETFSYAESSAKAALTSARKAMNAAEQAEKLSRRATNAIFGVEYALRDVAEAMGAGHDDQGSGRVLFLAATGTDPKPKPWPGSPR